MHLLKIVAVFYVAFSAASLWAENPMTYFRAEDAVAYSNCVKSLKNVQRGELYTMTWDANADYHMDRFLSEGKCTTNNGTTEWLCKNVLKDAPPPPAVTDTGCSAFAATNSLGQRLAGRNFDYRYQMAHALVYVPANGDLNRPHASISTVDCGWLGYDVGGLDDGIVDLSYAALFPHIPLDGLNDAGFMVAVLSLDARPRPGAGPGDKSWMTEQYYPDRTNIVTTAAIRYLLDHAGSTQEGIHILTNNFNMFQAIGGDIPIAANYHFYLCDQSGDTRVVEWLPPKDGSKNWTTWVTNATAVSNFYFYDGYGHGSNRWEILRHALARQNGRLEEDDAMCLCRAVSQKKGAEQTSGTHWSIVYNLKELSAHIATLGNYDEIFPYKLKGTKDWEFGAPKSSRPAVETNLPKFDASATATDRVYLLKNPLMPSDAESPLMDGSGVSAVDRMGCTSDSTATTPHVVIKKAWNRTALFYASMPADIGQYWSDCVVAGVNDKGVSARVARLKNTGGAGNANPSSILCNTLMKYTGERAVDAAAVYSEFGPKVPDTGVIFTDAKGNVAIWPAGAEPIVDDASEMFRNSLDLRKGIYEIDGDGRGQFDELPGLLRLAATDKTRAIVSMGYGHLDVMLPETNRVWRVALEDADIPQYGVVAEPPAVEHAAMKSLTYANGDPIERNNQDRIVAKVGAEMKVTYEVAEAGYYFSNGTGALTQQFTVGETTTTPPAETPLEPALKLGKATQRYPWNGIVDVKYRTTNWPAGKEAKIEVALGGKKEMVPLTFVGQGMVNGSVAIDLRALFGETRGEATFKVVK